MAQAPTTGLTARGALWTDWPEQRIEWHVLPDPSTAIFKDVAKSGGQMLPVIDRTILRQQVGGRKVYFAEETEVAQADWVKRGRNVVTACTPIALITGDPSRVSGDKARQDQKDVIATVEKLKSEDLVPPQSLVQRLLKRTRELSAVSVEKMIDLSEKARVEAGPALDKAKEASERAYEKAKEATKEAMDKAREALEKGTGKSDPGTGGSGGSDLFMSVRKDADSDGDSVLDYNATTLGFSNLREIAKETDPTYFLGWPSFLPDGQSFVYQLGDRDDYATWRGGSAELMVIDVATKNPAHLRLANGERGGQTYLQSRAEMFMNYEPSVLPVSVGGYYWVVFTSRRRYGNVITVADQDDPLRKKLWVAAIDMNAPPGTDPSHPAFFLPGQEIPAGNLRGYWVLEPCRQNGNSCESGSECCSGFCRGTSADGGAGFVCVAPPPTCSHEEEKCTQTSDCCDAPRGFACVNGFCARPTPK